jgi:hypothetical protein
MKNQLTAALHVTTPYVRKGGPWVGLLTSAFIIGYDARKNS